MKRVLITGASGFIGRHCLPALGALGYDVHAVCAKSTPWGTANWHRADLMVAEDVSRLFREIAPTHLLHLAWYTEHGKYWTALENLRWVEASLTILREFVARGGRRAVCAGTCAEYDWRFGYCSEPVTPLSPTTLYGTCKHALQLLATAYARGVDLSLAWGRIFFAYGPGDQPTRFVPSVIRSLLEGKPVRCTHGHQVRDYLHVHDVADAFAALLDSRLEGPVNIASGRPITLREFVRKLAASVPVGSSPTIEFGAIPTPPDDPPLLVGDVKRLSGELGWSPRYDHDRGIAETIRSLTPCLETAR